MDFNLKNKLEDFFSQYKLVKYKKGEIILRPGEKPNYVSFIKSGYVRVYTLSENGQEVTMQFFKPTLYFTMIYALTDIENRFYFEAITPVEMYVAPLKDVMAYMGREKEVEREVMHSIMMAFIDLVEQLGFLLSGSAYNKVASMVSSLTNRTEKELSNYSRIDFAVTHKMIASLTGLTRETVTLQMLRLEKEKIIDNSKRKIVVLDPEGLTRAAKSES